MRDFMVFSLEVLKGLVSCLFELDIGGYSFGAFLAASLVVEVFIGTLVIRFRNKAPSAGGFHRPQNTKE